MINTGRNDGCDLKAIRSKPMSKSEGPILVRWTPTMVSFAIIVVLTCSLVFQSSVLRGDQRASSKGYEVINVYPHDPEAFTQGLYFDNGFLIEGTGRYGRSSIRKIEFETSRIIEQVDLPSWLFGEGITEFGGLLYQLTWVAHTGFIYDADTFERRGQFAYNTEGWGLTHDDRHLVMSDGSAWLYFLDPQSFTEARRVLVHDSFGPIDQLNELEFVNGEIWANVWHQDEILQIDPMSGSVKGRIDLSGLLPQDYPIDPEGVLNGIAYDAEGDRLFVTGKLWPSVFEIRVTEP